MLPGVPAVLAFGEFKPAAINLPATDFAPGTRQFVLDDRLAQANDPGVGVSPLNTESAGNGTATVQESVMPDATGAWISVDNPFLPGGERFDGGC